MYAYKNARPRGYVRENFLVISACGTKFTTQRLNSLLRELSCYRWSPQNRSPRTICGKLCCRRWSPRTIYGCHGWSPRTICGAVSGPPWPQMVPLKLSLEMMSHGIYIANRYGLYEQLFSFMHVSCSKRPLLVKIILLSQWPIRHVDVPISANVATSSIYYILTPEVLDPLL